MVNSWCTMCGWCLTFCWVWGKMGLRQDLKVLPTKPLCEKPIWAKFLQDFTIKQTKWPSGDPGESSSKPTKAMLRRVRHCSFTQPGIFRRNSLRCGTFPWSWSWCLRLEADFCGKKNTGKMLRTVGLRVASLIRSDGEVTIVMDSQFVDKVGGVRSPKSATGDWNAWKSSLFDNHDDD